jgi:hypothetical protein
MSNLSVCLVLTYNYVQTGLACHIENSSMLVLVLMTVNDCRIADTDKNVSGVKFVPKQ